MIKLFIPKQIVFYAADKALHYYVLRHRWDGTPYLRPIKQINARQPYILLLDASLPFRRRFAFNLKQRPKKELVTASAAGLFPFPLSDMLCSLGKYQGEPYLFALRKTDFDSLLTNSGLSTPPHAVLVSDADENALLTAINQWRAHHDSYAFNNQAIPVNIAPLMTALLTSALLATVFAAIVLWNKHTEKQQNLKQQHEQSIILKAKPLLSKQLALSHFHAFFKGMDKLSRIKTDTLLATLLPILENLPEGSYIDEIKYSQNTLEVNGWGNLEADWFIHHGIDKNAIDITPLPKKNHFTFLIHPERP